MIILPRSDLPTFLGFKNEMDIVFSNKSSLAERQTALALLATGSDLVLGKVP